MEQRAVATKAMVDWLSHPNELGKAPSKIEIAGEFDLHGMHYYIFKYKQSLFGKWLLGVCGGYEANELEHCGHVFSDMSEYDEKSARQSAINMVEHICAYWVEQGDKYSEALARKERSIQKLKQYEVPYIEHLPHIETKVTARIRTREEIAKRAVTCLLIIQYACDLSQIDDVDKLQESKEFILDTLDKFGLKDCLTDNEKHILYHSNMAQQDIINMVWKYEAYWVLIWSLGLVPTLEYPSDACDCQHAIEVVSSQKSFEDFLATTTLRAIDEILDEADLIFRYDWACVDARVKGLQAPANLDSSVVVERHKALNWLIGVDEDDDWDNASTNT